MPQPFPHALQMRDLKYGARPAEEKDRLAARLRAEGRRPEALLLFEGRPDHPFVAEEAAHAAEHGLGFLLLQIRRMGGPVTEDLVRRCAASAEARGRFADARLCHQALGDRDALVRISAHLPASMQTRPEPPTPTTTTT